MFDHRKRGRPREHDSKHIRLEIRLNRDEAAFLDEIAYITGKNKSDVIRESLRMYGNLAKFRVE